MNTEKTTNSADPNNVRSQQITVNVSDAQASALAAFAGDRNLSQGDALLLLAAVAMNTEINLGELRGWIGRLSAAVLDEGRAGLAEDGEPLPYEIADAEGHEEPATGTGFTVLMNGTPFEKQDDGDAWKRA